MKKSALRFLLIVLAVILAMSLAACDRKGENIPSGNVVPWETYLDELAQAIDKQVSENKGQLSLALNGSASVGETIYDLFAGVSYDSSNENGSMVVIDIASSGKPLFKLCATNNYAYLDVAQTTVLDNAKYKLENTDIFKWSGADQNDGKIAGGLKAFGAVIFSGVDVNADKSEYRFEIDSALGWGEIMRSLTVLEYVDEDIAKVALGALGISDIEELSVKMPHITGQIVFEMEQGKLTGIRANELKINDELGKMDASFDVRYALDDTLVREFPAGDEGYKVTKMGSANMSGTLSMYDSRHDRRAIKYTYEMNLNLDIISLILSGYDFSLLDESNFFHFRLSHTCDSNCLEFCRSKLDYSLGGTQGAQLDIAFSPSDFGSNNIFVNVNLMHLLGVNYFTGINEYPAYVTTDTMPNYCLIALPYGAIKKDVKLQGIMSMLITDLVFGGESFDLSTQELLSLMSEGGIFEELLKNFFISEEFTIDSLSFLSQTYNYGDCEFYDVYKQTVYIIANDISQVKTYTNFNTSNHVIALDWDYQPQKELSDGTLLTNIFDKYGNLIHGVSDGGEYVPMSGHEADGLVGNYVKLDYVDIDKISCLDANGKIVAVEGLRSDYYLPQTIKLKIAYPSVIDYNYLSAIFGEYRDMIVDEIEANILLSPVESEQFVQQEIGEGRLTYNGAAPQFLRAQYVLTYQGGIQKTLDVTGTSQSVARSSGGQYSVVDWGNISVNFYIANRIITRQYTIENPTRFEFTINYERVGTSVGVMYSMTVFMVYVRMTAYYDEDQVDVYLRTEDLYIDGLSLNNDTSNWKAYKPFIEGDRYSVMFSKSNTYRMQIKKLDVVSDEFDFVVAAKQSLAPQYQLAVTEPSREHTFTNNNYGFIGYLSNRVHGVSSDTAKTVRLQVFGGTMSANGNVVYDRDDEYGIGEDIVYTTLRVGSETVGTRGRVFSTTVPEMIIDPIRFYITANFTQAGYYELAFTLSGGNSDDVRYSWYVYVEEMESI